MGNLYKFKDTDKEILRNLYQNREGLRVKTLLKLTNLKERNLYKRLNLLKQQDILEHIFPIWKLSNGGVQKCSILLKDSKIFELHNLSYVIPLIKTPDWWAKRSRKLIKLKGFQFKAVSWGKGSSNPYQQLINENYVIQTYPESIIVIFRKRYYSNQPYEVIIQAMNDFLDLWAWFEERMRFKFFIDGIPQIKLRSNDFNRLKDYLAENCKKRATGFIVEIPSKGKVWVDYSEPFGKEANYPEAQEILERTTKDLLLNKPLLPSEIQGLVSQLALNQDKFTKDIQSFATALNRHIPAYEGMQREVRELKEVIKKIQESLDKK